MDYNHILGKLYRLKKVTTSLGGCSLNLHLRSNHERCNYSIIMHDFSNFLLLKS